MSSLKLLTTGNTKTVKGEKRGYMTFILHLAPNTLSGHNVCPMATVGCAAACLNTAGRGIYDRTQNARIRKTKWFFEDRSAFMQELSHDIYRAERLAAKADMIPVIRLNGTSDIRWENVPVGGYKNLMECFPYLLFYDYTKIENRKNLPANYSLTFSRSETNIIPSHMNVAVVFGIKKGQPLPAVWNGRPVIDGDVDDLRFLDPSGVIVGLRVKGRDGKRDTSGFVVHSN